MARRRRDLRRGGGCPLRARRASRRRRRSLGADPRDPRSRLDRRLLDGLAGRVRGRGGAPRSRCPRTWHQAGPCDRGACPRGSHGRRGRRGCVRRLARFTPRQHAPREARLWPRLLHSLSPAPRSVFDAVAEGAAGLEPGLVEPAARVGLRDETAGPVMNNCSHGPRRRAKARKVPATHGSALPALTRTGPPPSLGGGQ